MTIIVFNFSIPLLICVFSYLWKEIFHEGKAVMENMWEFSLCFHFVPYKVNIPMYVCRGIFLCFLFVPYKVNIPVYAGEFKQTSRM
jgi:hypothetical protein